MLRFLHFPSSVYQQSTRGLTSSLLLSLVQWRPQRARRHHLHQWSADRHGDRRQRRHQEGGQLERSGSQGERGRDSYHRSHGDRPLTFWHWSSGAAFILSPVGRTLFPEEDEEKKEEGEKGLKATPHLYRPRGRRVDVKLPGKLKLLKKKTLLALCSRPVLQTCFSLVAIDALIDSTTVS